MKETSVPLEMLPFAVAKKGQMLVQRVEMPARRGRILLPYATREMNRASEAVVVQSELPDYSKGDCVVLTGTVSRCTRFGDGEKQIVLWPVTPNQILLRLKEPSEVKIEVGDDHYMRQVSSEDFERGDLEGVEEGEPWSGTPI